MKSAIKAIIPERVLHVIRQARRRHQLAAFRGQPIGATFDAIYARGLWNHGVPFNSGSGSYGDCAAQYVAFVQNLIRSHDIRSIVDVGCGDFNVGSKLCGHVEQYRALDVSQVIIDQNRKTFASLDNVVFTQLDGTAQPLPRADLVTIRQVLQHLTNAQIERVLRNVERSGARFALISEHVPTAPFLAGPNLDVPSHSADTRVLLDSGVFIDEAPFSRNARRIHTIPLSPESRDRETLMVFLWELDS